MITTRDQDTVAPHDEVTDAHDEIEAPEGDLGPATVLRSPSVTAERERTRLEQTAGRSGPGRLLVTAALAVRRLGTAEAASDGLRYRPVAWTIIAVLAVSWYLPGRVDRATVPEIAAAPSPVTTAVPSPEEPPTAAAPTAPDLDRGTPPPTFDPAPSPVFSPPSEGHSPAATTPTAMPGPSGPSGPTSADPLTIRGSGWATRLPPTPLPTDEVPEGTLPVANRLGSVDRVSFVRLDGDATTLELVEDEDSAREALGPAVVAACPIVDPSWAEEPEQSFDDAPQWDSEACVGGTESDGRWTFDLAGFEDRTGEAGFALVPTTDAPPDFQIAFLLG